MSRHVLEVAGLRRTGEWAFIAGADHPAITWWPRSLPGQDLDEAAPRPRRRPTPRIRRGRIQLVRR